MKKIRLIILFLFFTLITYSQQKNVVVAPTLFNVLYVGVDNPVDIAVEGVNSEDLDVSVKGGTVKKGGSGKYYVRVNKAGNAEICLSSGEKALGCKMFRCILLKDPQAYIGFFYGKGRNETIARSKLLNCYGVSAESYSYLDVKFTVTSFTLSGKIGPYQESAKSKSNKFTNAQKDIIRKVKSGSKIIIDDIKCIGPDGIVRKLDDVILKIR